jgi:hypothetical protein
VGLALPLFFFSDVLTQSMFLFACTLGALACFVGRRSGRDERLAVLLPAVVRTLTVGLYAAAAFHKLNRGFLHPDLSCARAGVDVLADNWAIDALASPALHGVWPTLFVAAELTIVALLVARPAAGMVVALLMHIPLTIVFAPSFAFTMISGWAAFLREDERAHLGRVIRERTLVIVLGGAGIGLTSFALYMQRHWQVYFFWSLKEAALWTLFVWLVVAWWKRPAGVFGWLSAWRERIPRGGGGLVAVFAVLWLANAALPYTGLTFHHTGAMLSNLRVDAGCWNSVVVPESVRFVEPYLRIDDATVGGRVPGRAVLEETLETTLYDRITLEVIREEMCRRGAAPVRARGTLEGRVFEVRDLCARPWPLGRPFMPGHRRFQTALPRDCAQTCVH